MALGFKKGRETGFESVTAEPPQPSESQSNTPKKKGRETGFEPATFGTTNRRSNQLSYNLRILGVQRYRTLCKFSKS